MAATEDQEMPVEETQESREYAEAEGNIAELSSLLEALQEYDDPELPLNEIVAFEDIEDATDDEILASLMEKIKSSKPSPAASPWLFTHDLHEEQWKTVERHLKEINLDFSRRLLMLLLRLDVTVMSFFSSSRLEHLEDKIRETHENGKTNLVIPKAAGICDLLVAEPVLLNIEKVKGNARTRVKDYMLAEAPPTRGASHRLQISSGAADPSAASRGRTFHGGRGGGHRGGRGGFHHRGRGNFKQQYSKRENESLESQVQNEIERQLAAASEGPKNKRNRK